MIAKENFEVNYENTEKSIALQNKTGTAYSRNHVWLPCDLSCSYFTRLWPKKSISVSPPGKRAINLSRLHYRLLAICCSCFYIIFYNLFCNLHRFLLPFSLEQALVRLQLLLRYFNDAVLVNACECIFSDIL